MFIAGLVSLMMLSDPDGIVTTAPKNADAVSAAMAAPAEASVPAPTALDAMPHQMTTEQQIQHWLTARSDRPTFDEAVANEEGAERRMHGMVDAGIGTGGYRHLGAAVSIPLGETGQLDLSYREGRNLPYSWGDPAGRWADPTGAWGPDFGSRWVDAPGFGYPSAHAWRRERLSRERLSRDGLAGQRPSVLPDRHDGQ